MAAMSPKDFRRWRKAMDLSQKDAAEALGLKRRVVQYYEKGERDGESVEIPKYVRLACYALMQGIKDYKGPPKDEAEEGRAGSESVETPVLPVLDGDGVAAAKPKPAKRHGKSAGRKGVVGAGAATTGPESGPEQKILSETG